MNTTWVKTIYLLKEINVFLCLALEVLEGGAIDANN